MFSTVSLNIKAAFPRGFYRVWYSQESAKLRKTSVGKLHLITFFYRNESVWKFNQILVYYRAYHPAKRGASQKELEAAALIIQKHVRGKLSRDYMDKVKEKVRYQL